MMNIQPPHFLSRPYFANRAPRIGPGPISPLTPFFAVYDRPEMSSTELRNRVRAPLELPKTAQSTAVPREQDSTNVARDLGTEQGVLGALFT